MLASCSVHALLAIRPHAACVLCRLPNGSYTRARLYSIPGVRIRCHCNTSEQIEGSQLLEQAVAGVLTLAVSISILLCDTPPSSAWTLGTGPLLQRDVLYGRPDSRPIVTGSITEDVDAVTKLTSEAEAAIRDGSMNQALQKYTSIVKEYPDLALAERARIKRALMLYETGAVEQALLELEDEEVALRGNAEVHAALAALLYAEKPSERQRAEQQWEVCCEFDNRYSNLEWVASNKMWGPRLLQALHRFLRLE